ncbi:Ring finger domain [Popillia japonica]|uniref:Ring finger domain n=1 Tax=Popillia japonica TaxID=7064 RepID=A0AAW1HSX0_POPJA
MELKDNCAICRLSMTRHDIKRLLPCKHLIHAKCFELSEAIIERVATCPICRTNVLDVEDIIRKVYRRYNNQDRERVVASANRGEGWTALAKSLRVHYKTAYHWVNSGREKMLAKGGYKPKILSEEEINTLLSWLEENCSLTLKQ